MSPRGEGRSGISMASEQRAKREIQTVGAMISIYCRGAHGSARALCSDCAELFSYAQQRVAHCPLIDDKPTCVNCSVHCYKPSMQERIKTVMRHSGPRMLWKHPVLSVFHLLDGRRKPLV